jgi:hypothetical protein
VTTTVAHHSATETEGSKRISPSLTSYIPGQQVMQYDKHHKTLLETTSNKKELKETKLYKTD